MVSIFSFNESYTIEITLSFTSIFSSGMYAVTISPILIVSRTLYLSLYSSVFESSIMSISTFTIGLSIPVSYSFVTSALNISQACS